MGYPKREVRSIDGRPHLQCRTCGAWKLPEDYYDGESSTLFRSTYCRPCHQTRNRKAQAEKRRRLGVTPRTYRTPRPPQPPQGADA